MLYSTRHLVDAAFELSIRKSEFINKKKASTSKLFEEKKNSFAQIFFIASYSAGCSLFDGISFICFRQLAYHIHNYHL